MFYNPFFRNAVTKIKLFSESAFIVSCFFYIICAVSAHIHPGDDDKATYLVI